MGPTLLGVITLTFIVTQFVPGGPVEQALMEMKGTSVDASEASGEGASASSYIARNSVNNKQIEQLKELYGFDRPPLERYWDMLKRFSHFDLGDSYYSHKSVWALIQSKLLVSISLGLWTFLITYLIAVPLGVAKAVRSGSRFDFLSSVAVMTGHAIPGFVLGIFLLVLFGGGTFWDLFPLRGLTSDNWEKLSLSGKVLDYLWHITLPVTALVVSSLAVKTMLTKMPCSNKSGGSTFCCTCKRFARRAYFVEACFSECHAAFSDRVSHPFSRRLFCRKPFDRNSLFSGWFGVAIV